MRIRLHYSFCIHFRSQFPIYNNFYHWNLKKHSLRKFSPTANAIKVTFHTLNRIWPNCSVHMSRSSDPASTGFDYQQVERHRSWKRTNTETKARQTNNSGHCEFPKALPGSHGRFYCHLLARPFATTDRTNLNYGGPGRGRSALLTPKAPK